MFKVGEAASINTTGSSSAPRNAQPAREIELFPSTGSAAETGIPDKEPKFLNEKTVTVKGEDGKKYKATEVTTEETDSSGKTWNVKTTTYTDKDGHEVSDTTRTYTETHNFSGKNVDITTTKQIRKGPNSRVTVDTEESDYYVKTTTWTRMPDGSEQGQESFKSKKKLCKWPDGLSQFTKRNEPNQGAILIGTVHN